MIVSTIATGFAGRWATPQPEPREAGRKVGRARPFFPPKLLLYDHFNGKNGTRVLMGRAIAWSARLKCPHTRRAA